VRASNGGVSAVIDPWGMVVSRLALARRGRLAAVMLLLP
jgi:apolipoprotein N-acyltransferase